MKGYLNPRWCLVTTIDLRSKSCIWCTLETGLWGILLQIYLYKSSTITRSLGKVWLEILVANLATNFQDLVAKVKNLVALAPVSGAILHPESGLILPPTRKLETTSLIVWLLSTIFNKRGREEARSILHDCINCTSRLPRVLFYWSVLFTFQQNLQIIKQ